MMKRIIALLLALILTVGLLPTVALAAGETANNDVVSGSIGEDGNWTPVAPNQSNKPEGVETVSKTAKKVEGEENKYEVTLKVVLKQTEENSGKAATVLVLDTSGSMAYCAECGAEPEEDCEHNYVPVLSTPSETGTYYYKYTNKNGQVEFGKAHYCNGQHTFKEDHPAGWFKTKWYESDHNTQGDALSANNLYRKKPRASRLDAAKVGAENFLKTYSGLTFKTDGTVAANQNSRNLGRYVSVVSFATGAALKQEWVDVSNSDVYQKVLKNIKGLSAEGGTNLDAGLTYAEYLLKKTTVKDAVKNVIALTDGQPTYCLKKNCNDIWHLLGTKLTIGSTKYCVHGDGTECTDEIYNSTVDTATRVKNVPSKLYTVCFDAGETIDVPNNGGQISVSEYLSTKIATQPTKTGEQFAYDADNAEKLYAEFAKITQSIVSGLSTGTVKDTLPTGITSTAFETASVEWDLVKDFHPESVTKQEGEKQVTTYTYTKTYTVTIDPKTVKTEKVDGVDYAPLNGKTTLTVGSGADAKEIPFPIPAGKVTMPSHTVTWKSQDGITTLETDNNVEYNTKPSFDRADPTKPDDAQYTYTFVGWATEANREIGTPEANLPPVTDDVTYYAAFSKTARTYTVTWMPQDGQSNAYETDTGVAYNASPSYDSEVPTKAADDKYTYTFAGWATTTNQTSGSTVDALPNVTENVTYYAAFSATPRTYTVTFKDGANGEVFEDKTQQVEYGKDIPSHDNPVRPGYNFTGWTSEPANYQPGTGTMPANNITFTAQWTAKGDVTIHYVAKDGGTVTPPSETLNPDTGVAKGSTATANTGYRFVGWYDNADCMGTALSTQTAFTPIKPDSGWVTTTYYAKFEQIQVNVNLSPYVKKTLEVDGTLPTGFSETFKVDVTVDGQRLQQQGTVTMTAAGTSNFNMPTVALTEGTHTIMVQEVVDEQTKNSNIAYDTNQKTFVLNILTSGAAAPVQYGTTNSDGNFDEVKEPAFVTITNTYTEPKEPRVVSKTVVTTNMVDTLPLSVSNDIAVFKIVNKVDILYPVVNGEASTLEVPYGTKSVTLLYKITVNAGTKTSMQFEDVGAECVSIVDDDDVDVTQVGRTFTVQFYRGVTTADIYVAKTYAKLVFDSNGECTVENVISEEIKATTTVTEKDPNKLTINFADYVQKELTATGTKTASDVNFTVNVKESPIHVINSAQGEEAVSTYAGELLSTTLNAHFDSITGGETKTTPFTGSVEITSAGQYIFELREEDGQRTGVTYDETIYTLHVLVDEKEGSLAVTHWYFTDSNRVEHNAGEKAAFHNTIDTGKDDYYPIIIPTIINKDTGMLNKTDHFAYVIGYPDGTVHPNGQITRAEVATIFFRLLRDEVRDGAFTTSNSYSDVAYGKWYNNPISTMSALGIITGYPDGTFKPNKPITRAEFAAIAARFDETQSGKSATFSDVIGHWAAKEIGIAYANEWIKGYPDGTFKPDQNITRAEAMTLINRVLERKPESPADLLTNMNKWTDNLDTSKWYYLDVQEATNSHGYTRKTFNYELWRQMLPDPDWSRYER
ncbi:MAG: VWA domain-containing protein [Oscillospiraceae bacterium]|nr:VWA domain-containing protein [Oscillospiraceae bacterium]